jgi:ubiquinone/menaquinone biosynthesis C-methylase UbiE/DNA-binding transcriptional ArsR family regulator
MRLSTKEIVDMLGAAGEPSRLRILALLQHGELAVLELCRVLDQSQPRVSRHLKLLADAGLVERFPDGAWVFYGLAGGRVARALTREILNAVDPGDPVLALDSRKLAGVAAERETAAGTYFAENAAQWDQLRSLHVSDADLEAEIVAAAGPGRIERLVDLGSGTGRMLTLLGPRAEQALGLDLSHQMLNIARRNVAEAGLAHVELRHGDIFHTRLEDGAADLVVVHQVLHYLGDPAAAVREAGRIVAPGGRLILVDFAPHALEALREQHQHRRLGFADEEIDRWLADAGLPSVERRALPPAQAEGLTVKIWAAARAPVRIRSAA